MACIENMNKILLVTNMGDDSISIIDLTEHRKAGRIYLGASAHAGETIRTLKKPAVGPHSIVMDKNMGRIYTVNSFSNTVSVIDMNSLEVIDSFFAGSHPNDMVFNSDGTCAYVTNGDSDSVSIIDMEEMKIICQVSVGSMPHGICISPGGEFAYTADMGGDSISVIDVWSNSKIFCIKTGEQPLEIETSADGKFLYVTCSFLEHDERGTVSIISTNNNRVIKNIEVGMIPAGMYISHRTQSMYVANTGSNDIYIIDLNRFEVTKKIRSGNMARGIISDEEGHIFITNGEDNTVSVIDEKSGEITEIYETGIEPTAMLYINRVNL